jgi:predicted Holliday junction resolvase-like endonuclease
LAASEADATMNSTDGGHLPRGTLGMRIRLSTLLLLTVILGLIVALVLQNQEISSLRKSLASEANHREYIADWDALWRDALQENGNLRRDDERLWRENERLKRELAQHRELLKRSQTDPPARDDAPAR